MKVITEASKYVLGNPSVALDTLGKRRKFRCIATLSSRIGLLESDIKLDFSPVTSLIANTRKR